MREYKTPKIEVLEFSKEDVIRTSSLVDGGQEGNFTDGGAQGGWGSKSSILE